MITYFISVVGRHRVVRQVSPAGSFPIGHFFQRKFPGNILLVDNPCIACLPPFLPLCGRRDEEGGGGGVEGQGGAWSVGGRTECSFGKHPVKYIDNMQ